MSASTVQVIPCSKCRRPVYATAKGRGYCLPCRTVIPVPKPKHAIESAQRGIEGHVRDTVALMLEDGYRPSEIDLDAIREAATLDIMP